MNLFYGKANCSSCHSGSLLSDQKFHSIGIPQFGPGRTRPFDPYARDVGRMVETDNINDMYKFKTPALRNVSLTCLLYTSPSPRDRISSRMPSSA